MRGFANGVAGKFAGPPRRGGSVLILRRYLIGEMVRPFAFILGILATLFAGYCAAGILADAVNSLLPTDTLLESVGLKVLISLEVLIPISLLIAVMLAFGRLHSDSEITAIAALGIAPARPIGAVLTLSAWLAVAVAAVSLFARPWAYWRLHELSQAGAAMLNVDAMQPGTFYIDQGGRRVIYFAARSGPAQARDVFVRLVYPDHTEIIHAATASRGRLAGGDPGVSLENAHIYKLGAAPGEDQIVDTRRLTADPDSGRDAGRYDIAAIASARLFASGRPADVAEWQWRLSTPVSTLLLGLLGLPLGRVRPRQNRYAKFGTAIVIYALYYLLCLSARTAVAQGHVGAFPGLWWVPLLLAVGVAAALCPRYPAARRRRPA